MFIRKKADGQWQTPKLHRFMDDLIRRDDFLIQLKAWRNRDVSC